MDTYEGLARLEWWVLDWNLSAVEFHRSLDAESMSEWTVNRVSGDALKKLAAMADVAAAR